MVKIRLRRIGTKGRPFYRVVVAHSTAGRNGKFVENIGTYDPLSTPKVINIDESRAMHWLMNGAQPTETTAYLLNKIGVLPKYLEARPNAKKQFDYLDKTTAAISKPSAIGPAAEPKAAKTAPEPEPAKETEAAAASAPVSNDDAAASAPETNDDAAVSAPETNDDAARSEEPTVALADEPAGEEAPAIEPAPEPDAEDAKPEGE